VLVGVAIGIISLLPGLGGVRSALAAASAGWVAGAAVIQLVGIAGAVVFRSAGVCWCFAAVDLEDGWGAYLIGQLTQVIPVPAAIDVGFAAVLPVPGGIGAIDAGVVGALVLYGANIDQATAGELIAHGLALLVPILVGVIPFVLLPGEIRRTRRY
jgi:hypothetical protein